MAEDLRPWIDDTEPLPIGPIKWLSERYDMGAYISITKGRNGVIGQRRQKYFHKLDTLVALACDDDVDILERLTTVRAFFALRLVSDKDFNKHVWRPDATDQGTEEGWRKIYEAGAATIMEAYRLHRVKEAQRQP